MTLSLISPRNRSSLIASLAASHKLRAVLLLSQVGRLGLTVSCVDVYAFSAPTSRFRLHIIRLILLCVNNLSLTLIMSKLLLSVNHVTPMFRGAFTFILELAYCYEEFVGGAEVFLGFHVVLSGRGAEFLDRIGWSPIFNGVEFLGLHSVIISIVIFVYSFRRVRQPIPFARCLAIFGACVKEWVVMSILRRKQLRDFVDHLFPFKRRK